MNAINDADRLRHFASNNGRLDYERLRRIREIKQTEKPNTLKKQLKNERL